MSTTTTPIPIATHIKEEPAFSPPYHVENASDSDGEEESNSATCYGVKVVAKTPVSSPVGEVTVQKKQKITKEEKAQKAAERKAKKEAAEEEKVRKAAERKAKKEAAEEEKARKAAEREIKKKAIEEKKAAAEAEKALKAAARKAKKEAAEADKAEKAAKRAAKKKATDEKTTKKTTDLLANLGIGETTVEELQAENFVQPKVTHENAAEENVHAQQIEDVEPMEEVVVEVIEAMVDGRMQNVEVVEQQIKEVEKAVDSKEGDIVDEDANSPSNDSLDLDAEDVSNKMNELRGFIKKQNELLEEQKKTAHEINRIYGDLANMFGESPTG